MLINSQGIHNVEIFVEGMTTQGTDTDIIQRVKKKNQESFKVMGKMSVIIHQVDSDIRTFILGILLRSLKNYGKLKVNYW